MLTRKALSRLLEGILVRLDAAEAAEQETRRLLANLYAAVDDVPMIWVLPPAPRFGSETEGPAGRPCS